jgi:hypothetical protein
MEEIKTVKRMFAEPPPTPSAVAAGRERLVGLTHSRTRRRAPLWSAGIALAAAATTVVVVAANGGSGGSTTQQPIHLTAAQEVLGKAARNAEKQPDLAPKPHQWVYYRLAGYDLKRKTHLYKQDSWQRLDGAQDASRLGGRIVIDGPRTPEPGVFTPLGSWKRLAALPTETHAMISALRGQTGLSSDGTYSDGDQRAFANARELLWNSPLGAPPKAEAALFRALATLPGIRVDKVKDAIGDPAIGLSLPHTGEILLAPETYRFLGTRVVSDGVQKRPQPPAGLSAEKLKAWTKWASNPANYRVPPAGTLVSSQLRIGAKLVDKPGDQ